MSSSRPKRTRKSLPDTSRASPAPERKRRRRTAEPRIEYDKQAMEQPEELQKSIAEAEQFELIIEPESVVRQRRIDEEDAERRRIEGERRKIIDTIKKSAKTKDKKKEDFGPNNDTPEKPTATPTRAGMKQAVPRRLSFDPEENEKRTPVYRKEAAKENQPATSKRKRRPVNYNQEEEGE